MGVDVASFIMATNTHLSSLMRREKDENCWAVDLPRSPSALKLCHSVTALLEFLLSSNSVLRANANSSVKGETCSKCVKASVTKMHMINLVFDPVRGPELPFHFKSLEHIAFLCHLELLNN